MPTQPGESMSNLLFRDDMEEIFDRIRECFEMSKDDCVLISKVVVSGPPNRFSVEIVASRKMRKFSLAYIVDDMLRNCAEIHRKIGSPVAIELANCYDDARRALGLNRKLLH